MSDPIRTALAELVTLHLDESPRQPGDDADAWADAWAAARAALAEQPSVREPLTRQQIERLVYEHTKLNPNMADDKELLGYIVNAVRAIEAAHGIGVKGEA